MIVIPMAGLSRRFREAGYDLPKYMLDLHGRTLFARTVGSFAYYFATEMFLFIARDEADTPSFIQKEAEALGIARFKIVTLANPTRGQAETVRFGIDQTGVAADESLTIFNIDTIRPGFRHPRQPWMATTDGYLEVMPSDDPGYSYVRPDPSGNGRVLETAEKRVISNLASTGLYYFRRADRFMAALESEMKMPSANELYVAPLYNSMIAQGSDIHFTQVDEADVLFCGVPDQYTDLLDNKKNFD